MMGRSTTVGSVQVSAEILSQREALLVRPQAMQASFTIRHIIALVTQAPRPSL